MKDELKKVAKEAMKLLFMCEQLDQMNDPNCKLYYDAADFSQIEIEIREMKELVISKIEKL